MKQTDAKKWFIKCISSILIAMLAVFLLVLIVDPYFHYHKPFSFISYRLYEERYINDGISRHFDYDTLITGTSMAQNYKVSELNELFEVNAVKETFSGAGFGEISDNLSRALRRNPNIKKVFYSFDYNGLVRDKDFTTYENYPTYLYDDNIWNDMLYIFNKDIIYRGVLYNVFMTLTGKPSTTMDEYSSWEKETGLEHILALYDRNNCFTDIPPTLEGAQRQMVVDNVKQNVIDIVKQYPDVEFYFIYTPFSICYWDSLSQENSMMRQFMAEQLATEMMLECDNIRLYNFYDQYDLITDPNNYRDKEHYGSHVNSMILKWLSEDVGRITKDNYMEKLEQEKEFYLNYDYDSIYTN